MGCAPSASSRATSSASPVRVRVRARARARALARAWARARVSRRGEDQRVLDANGGDALYLVRLTVRVRVRG